MRTRVARTPLCRPSLAGLADTSQVIAPHGKKLDTLLNPMFLGKEGVRTVFMIEIKERIVCK